MENLLIEAQEVQQRWMRAMLEGDFEEAWRQTDRLEIPRRQTTEAPGPPESYLRWDGTPLQGQHVLVRCLHGLGDTVQFARYLPEVRRMAASVITLAQPALVPLLKSTPALGEIRNGWTNDPAPDHTVELEIMELPYIFRSQPATVPRPPYLDLKNIRRLSSVRLPRPAEGLIRVGLVWASSGWNPSRSIPLAILAPLADLTHLRLYSLQQESLEEPCAVPLPLQDISLRTRPVLEAAAAMLQLDLIVTVDTLAAHLAGALGCPVWLLLQHEADWRWQRSGSKSPWYPSMQIFRQPSPGDWDSVGKAVTQELGKFRSSRMAPTCE